MRVFKDLGLGDLALLAGDAASTREMLILILEELHAREGANARRLEALVAAQLGLRGEGRLRDGSAAPAGGAFAEPLRRTG